MSHNDVYIIKASGERELFSDQKLRLSLKHSGASDAEVEKVIAHVKSELEDGMTTTHIYQHAFSFLHTLENPRAMRRYSLRRALIELGPTGFPFEKYLSEIFKARGYEVVLNQMVRGSCVPHEMDVIAYNDSKLLMIESKFHNKLGEKSDLKVALYVKARFDDLSEQMFDYGKKRPLDEGWLITNTKFTEHAIQYGTCAGLRMIGWNHPPQNDLQAMIEDSVLHPITCLPNLTSKDRELLLHGGMVLCRQVIESKEKMKSLGVSDGRASDLVAQAKAICAL